MFLFVSVLRVNQSSLDSMAKLNSVDSVTAAYKHALFAKFPKRRYIVGVDAYVMVVLTYLPAFLIDYMYTFLAFKMQCYKK